MPTVELLSRPLGRWISPAARAYFFENVVGQEAPSGDLATLRSHYGAINHLRFQTAMQLYPVKIEESDLNGVPVAIITPADGVTDGRTLMCLHGGGFMWGQGEAAWLEALPVAVAMGCTVVAVDYRLAPEHIFPAAVDDALACFRSLLARQPASSLGIFGSSAGAMLCAQLVARLIAEEAQLPGAIAMLHGGALDFDGDSVAFSINLDGSNQFLSVADLPYFASADLSSPLVLPANHPQTLAKFPVSLLITGTRDFAGSAVTMTHRRLLQAGVSASLVMFDGLWHAHHVDTELPESQEVFAILSQFFKEKLIEP